MAAPSKSSMVQTAPSSVQSNYQSELERARRFHLIVDNLIGEKKYRRRPDAFVPKCGIPQLPLSREEIAIRAVYDSCPFKAVASCVIGFALGGAFGLFTSAIDPMSTMTTETPTTKMVLQEMKTRTWSMGKNFAVVGAMFATTDCIIESYRGKTEPLNGTISGGIVGGLLGFRAGLRAAVLGAAGFALFSTAIEYYMNS